MRVLIHGINHAPELTGVGKYTGEMAQWLAAAGHEVRVVTAPPYYPFWQVQAGYSGWRYQREDMHGVRVLRCPIWVPQQPTGATRMIHLLSFAISSLPVMLQQIAWKPDVVMVVEPTFLCAPSALLTARLAGGRAWLHIQDFEIDAAFELGILSSQTARRWVERAERWLLHRFDRVSAISQSMVDRLSKLGVGVDQTFLLPNWVDASAIRPSPDEGRAFRREQGIAEDRFVVLYSGNLGVKQGLDLILAAAKLLAEDPKIQFLLVGDGVAKSGLQAEAAKENLTNVTFLPLVGSKRLAALLSAADLHLVVQRRGAGDLVMPSKLAGIMAVGGTALIAAGADTELGRIALQYPEVAFFAECENAAALARSIREARRTLASRPATNDAARAYAEQNLATAVVLARLEVELRRLRQAEGAAPPSGLNL